MMLSMQTYCYWTCTSIRGCKCHHKIQLKYSRSFFYTMLW